MSQKADGRLFVPGSAMKAEVVVKPGEFNFAVLGLVHGHINGIIAGLKECGATLKSFWDDDQERCLDFSSRYPEAVQCESVSDILDDKSINLVINCIRPDLRCLLSVKCLEKGKNVFSDKPGFLTVEEYKILKEARDKSNKHYYIYFSEKFHSESSILTQKLIDSNRIGKVFHYIGTGPHRLNASSRPLWFFDSKKNGSIIIDLACHLVEQFMSYTNCEDVTVEYAKKVNVSHKEYKDFYDKGEVVLKSANGATAYIYVDWFTPDGLSAWGDGRTYVSGTDGFIEVRKYTDITISANGDRLYVVDSEKEEFIDAKNKTGFPFFPQMIKDCIDQTDLAVSKDHCLNAMLVTVIADDMC